ncbi:hypothetical protein [Bacillus benzoevorans]|uniref:SCP2 domain-containing protein n=1 Tax=Bacillus benzoevorans TaxID=1456 RepID=A0A7X0HSF5_9BACI|nr:hypothetical protein [Bacillus benzoevorans]MBB6445037.1 hypothetical protein [Bacillus benzoevorans]
MRELLTLWALEVNRKKVFRFILKELRLSFYLLTENEQILVKIENDTLQLPDNGAALSVKSLAGKQNTFLSLFAGERKLRKAVVTKDVETTLSFREQLLLEALFYLARPEIP